MLKLIFKRKRTCFFEIIQRKAEGKILCNTILWMYYYYYYYHHYHYHYYFSSSKSFIPVFNCGLSLKSLWQQVSLGLQDSSEHYNWPLQFCGQVGLIWNSNNLFFQAFGDYSKCTIYDRSVSLSPSYSTPFLIPWWGLCIS